MTENLVTILLIGTAVFSALRVEHLLASDLWIVLRGKTWKAKMRRLSIAQQGNAVRMWGLYRTTGGGKLPFLFFGIKSYRLYAWSTANRHRVMRSAALWCVRAVWRYYYFSPAMSLMVTLLAFAPLQLAWPARYALLAVAYSTVIGMIAIAAEIVLSAFTFQSWSLRYHRWPRPGGQKADRRLEDISLLVGCALLSWLSAIALLAIVCVRFHGYDGFPYHEPIPRQVETIITDSAVWLLSNVSLSYSRTIGFLASLLITFLYVAYVVLVLVFAVGPLLKRE